MNEGHREENEGRNRRRIEAGLDATHFMTLSVQKCANATIERLSQLLNLTATWL